MNPRNPFDDVAALVRETLLLDDEPIKPEHLLFYDLSFTTMDMLDLLFRIQEHFQVDIRRDYVRPGAALTVLDLPGYMQIFITYRRTALSATEALADLLAASFEQQGEEKSIVREPL